MLPSFVPVPNVADATLRRVQDAVQKVLRRVCQCPLIDGVLVPVTFAAGGVAQPVVHRLGRVPVGYFLVGSNANVTVFRAATATDSTALSLTCNLACSTTLWIF